MIDEDSIVDTTRSTSKVSEAISRLRPMNRILYPGLAVALFISHRYDDPVFQGLTGQSVPSIVFSILIGTIVYFIYRSLLLPVVWFFQARTLIGMPSRETHQSIVDDLATDIEKNAPLRDSVLFSQSCLKQFQAEALSTESQSGTSAYNAGSHILYLTSTLGILFFIHDVVIWPLVKNGNLSQGLRPPNTMELIAWLFLFVLGLASAIVYDRTADYREVIALWRHKNKYKEIVESAVKSWPFGRHRITYQERFLFYAGDGGLVVMLGLASFTSISVYRGWLSTWWLYAAIILLIMWVFLAKLLLRLRLQWRLRKSDLSTLDSDN